LTHTEHFEWLAEVYGAYVVYHSNPFSTAGCAIPAKPQIYRWSAGDTIKYGGWPNKAAFFSFPRNTIIVPRPWKCIDAYWTCIHELGHIALRHTPKRYKASPLKGEMDAWLWAFEYSIHPLSRQFLNRVYDHYISRHPFAKKEVKANPARLDRWYDKAENLLY